MPQTVGCATYRDPEHKLLSRQASIGDDMRKRLTHASRNSLDLADRVQVRVMRKRLGLSEAEFSDLVRKAGNSITAIKKEAAAMQRPSPAAAVETSPIEVMASTPDSAPASVG